MAVDTQEARYKERLLALTCAENESPPNYIVDDAYHLNSYLRRAPKVKSILSQPNTPEAQELIGIIKFYLGHFPAAKYEDFKEHIAATVVELGYVDDDIVNRLNPWFRLFFNLKKANTSLEELQQWLFDAGFDQPFSDYDKKELSARLMQPHENIDYYSQYSIIENLFGTRIRTLKLINGDMDGTAILTAELLNTIQPSLNIISEAEIWEEEKLNSIVATPVAAKLLGYELEIPEDKYLLAQFTYNNQLYGFYLLGDSSPDVYIAMRNIDCFLSYVDRPERIFVFTPYDAEGVLFVLAEPEKFKKLAQKIGFYFNDAEAEAEIFQDDDMLPSLSTLQFHEIQKPKLAPVVNKANQDAQKLTQRQIAVIDKAADTTFHGLHWAVLAFIAFILFFAAKDAISTLRNITAMVPNVGGIGQTIWVLTPYVLLGFALIKNRMFSLGNLFAASVFVSLFSLGAYGMAPSRNAVASDANIFIWVPLVQLLWIFGCYYVLRNR